MALTYRNIDKALSQYPGASGLAVSSVDYGSLVNNLDTNAVVSGDKKHVVYSPKVPAPRVTTIHPDANVRSGDIYVRF